MAAAALGQALEGDEVGDISNNPTLLIIIIILIDIIINSDDEHRKTNPTTHNNNNVISTFGHAVCHPLDKHDPKHATHPPNHVFL